MGSCMTNQFDSVAMMDDNKMRDSSGTVLREHECVYGLRGVAAISACPGTIS
jgi:hypothetical protein